MKKKELKNLAKQIVACEKVIKESSNAQAVTQAQSKITELSQKVNSLEDLFELDAIIYEMLEK